MKILIREVSFLTFDSKITFQERRCEACYYRNKLGTLEHHLRDTKVLDFLAREYAFNL